MFGLSSLNAINELAGHLRLISPILPHLDGIAVGLAAPHYTVQHTHVWDGHPAPFCWTAQEPRLLWSEVSELATSKACCQELANIPHTVCSVARQKLLIILYSDR